MADDDTDGYEACLTDPEGKRFVGTTAKFGDNWEIIPLRPELRLGGADPDFEGRRDQLIEVARSTCGIGVRRYASHGEYAAGTAFFVGPTTLLTAGHLVHDSRDKVIAEAPGSLEVTYFIEDLFAEPNADSPQRFECKLVKTLFLKDNDADISVLKVVGSTYTSPNFIEVKQQSLAEECDGSVDILGYPGDYTSRDVRKMHPSSGLVDGGMIYDVETLFPKRKLVITHGSVTHGGHLPLYQVSTVKGMSGGPLIMNGIHTKTDICARRNRGVSFEWDKLWKLLRDCGIIETDVGSGGSGEEGASRNFWGRLRGESSKVKGEPEKTPSQTQFREKTPRKTSSVPNTLPN